MATLANVFLYSLCVRVKILLISTIFDQISKMGRVGDNKLNKHPIISAPLLSLFLNIFPPSNNENEGRQLLRQIPSIIKDEKDKQEEQYGRRSPWLMLRMC